MKKFVALLLVMLMVLALNVVAVADGPDGKETISIENGTQDIDVKASVNVLPGTKKIDAVYAIDISWEVTVEGSITVTKDYGWDPETLSYTKELLSSSTGTYTIYIDIGNRSNRGFNATLTYMHGTDKDYASATNLTLSTTTDIGGEYKTDSGFSLTSNNKQFSVGTAEIGTAGYVGLELEATLAVNLDASLETKEYTIGKITIVLNADDSIKTRTSTDIS